MKYPSNRLLHSNAPSQSAPSFFSSSSLSCRRKRSAPSTFVLISICVTILSPSPTSCQLLGSLMSMTGLGSLNPFSGLGGGGGGLLSGLRGGGSSSLFGSLTGSSSSLPGVGSMMSSFTPDLGAGSMNYGQQIPMLSQIELAEIMSQQQNQPSFGHGFDEHAPPPQRRPPTAPRPSPSAPHGSQDEREYDGPPRGQGRGPRDHPRGGRGGGGGGYGSRPQSSEETERPRGGSYQGGARRPPSGGYGNGPRGAPSNSDDSYESEERQPQGGPRGPPPSNYQGDSGSESSYEEQPYDTPAPASNYHSNNYRQPVSVDEGGEEGEEDGGYGSGSTPVSAAGGYDYPPVSSPSTLSSHSQHRYSSPSREYHNNAPRTRVHQYSYSGDDGGQESATSPSSQNYNTEGTRVRRQRYQQNEPSSYYHSSMHHPRPQQTASSSPYYSNGDDNGNDGSPSVTHYHQYQNNNYHNQGGDEGSSSDDTPSSYYNSIPNTGPGMGNARYHSYSSNPQSDYYNDEEEQPTASSNVHFPSGQGRRYY